MRMNRFKVDSSFEQVIKVLIRRKNVELTYSERAEKLAAGQLGPTNEGE